MLNFCFVQGAIAAYGLLKKSQRSRSLNSSLMARSINQRLFRAVSPLLNHGRA
ncbi:hypothetical protein [Planktothricoides raciborskii]|uniref:Transposase n=1 Tax=Planktothricoides raciborskii FACHB-1370 TaxID=2949576 RepID=A0ABR8EM78_9CYAN|nr:hypothetical protein [Planktothricoides raciborskii]MBD2547748.1 hypothetical protein [Planktothricoides raciborskii FACHB-1370]MBD2586182.1 hypothetical protein [Planktothricoides raciborskii FACHB-1261]